MVVSEIQDSRKRKAVNTLLVHSRSDKRKQKDILKVELQIVRDIVHVSLWMEELREAELDFVKEKKFPEESSSLQKGQNVKWTNHIHTLNLVLEVLWGGGRLSIFLHNLTYCSVFCIYFFLFKLSAMFKPESIFTESFWLEFLPFVRDIEIETQSSSYLVSYQWMVVGLTKPKLAETDIPSPTTFCSLTLSHHWNLLSFKRTSMLSADGNKYSICPICFRKDGQRSTCRSFRNI